MSRVENLKTEILSNFWASLKKITFDYQTLDKTWHYVEREVYDRGQGVAVLLYNKERATVILVKQFRIPVYLNGDSEGMTLEVCAGMLDEDDPEKAIIREIEEETGYCLNQVEKVLTAYASPGADMEQVHLFIAAYNDDQKIHAGGGLATEHEDLIVEEYAFAKAYSMIQSGAITDAKTIILLQYAKLHALL